MVELMKEFPFTMLLALVGGAIGGLILPEESTFLNYNFSGIGVNPVAFFTDYFANSFNLELKGIFFGAIFAIIFGIIGFIIDFSRKGDED